MGHRLSKSYWSSSNSSSNTNASNREGGINCVESQKSSFSRRPAISNTHSAESSQTNNSGYHFQTATVTVPTQNSTQSVIIKIQLSKMEPDAPIPFATMELPSNSSHLLSSLGVDQEATTSAVAQSSRLNDLSRPDNHDQNFNITAMTTSHQPVLNVTVTNRVACNNPATGSQSTEEMKLSNLNSQMQSTMSSNNISNSNLCNEFNRISLRPDDVDNANFGLNNNRTSQFPSSSRTLTNEENRTTNASIFSDISNNNDVRSLDQPISNIVISSTESKIKNMDTCQHRLGSTISHQSSRSIFGGEHAAMSTANGEGSSVRHVQCCQHKNYPLASKWAFCECAYREGVKNFGQFTLNLDNNSDESVQDQQTSQEKQIPQEQQPPQEQQIPPEINMPATSPQMVAGPPCVILLSVNHPTSPQFVVGPIEDCDERARRQRALEIEQGIETAPGFLPQHQQLLSHLQTSQISPSLNFPQSNILPEIGPAIAAAIAGSNAWHMHTWHGMNSPLAGLPNFGPKVHSQMDFIHCLVPDLDKITNSSFYWGKMDRYEAESLLEGKPEGTFLLRDSAQEEYLFSVTFRKYGRSLHARIEQFNHKFSFDCHDPCVYTAPTVTGLLEHYKDPSCVMFFEPCLTIPLHRNFTFSLQQLCRASIVSRISYDGIKELHLPNSLKSYLREYHYKLRVRVKPVDEMFYSCS